MITIRPAVPEELPQLKDLWRKCFGDPSTYVDIFYQKFCPVEQVLVVDEVGELDSMAAMLPGTVHLPDGTDIPVGYVYALATNPYMQGKGHARQLLKYADEYLQKRGDKAMILVPASPSLHRFFETVGYLKDTFHVTYSDNMITFQQIGSHMAYGDLYKIEVDGVVGCAAIEYVQKRRLLAKELLIPPAQMGKAVETIAKEMEASRYHIRTPAFWDGLSGSYTQAFGMIKWYDQDLHAKYCSTQDAYLGLGFD